MPRYARTLVQGKILTKILIVCWQLLLAFISRFHLHFFCGSIHLEVVFAVSAAFVRDLHWYRHRCNFPSFLTCLLSRLKTALLSSSSKQVIRIRGDLFCWSLPIQRRSWKTKRLMREGIRLLFMKTFPLILCFLIQTEHYQISLSLITGFHLLNSLFDNFLLPRGYFSPRIYTMFPYLTAALSTFDLRSTRFLQSMPRES